MINKPSLVKTHPELATEWHPKLNGDLKPDQVTINYNKKIWWKCPKEDDHIWDVSPRNRRQRSGRISKCPFCSSHRTCFSNSIARTHPHLVGEWHPTKNGDLKPEMFVKRSTKKIWWKCKNKGHEWEAKIESRTKRKGYCPICTGQLVIPETSLSRTHPRIAKEWSSKNSLKPTEVTHGSKKKYLWQCPKHKSHIYDASIANRTNLGRGCPYCSGKKLHSSNSLSNVNPKIASLWHPTLNEKLTPKDVTHGSGLSVWWKCPKGEDHVWKAPIGNLTSGGQLCPVCAGKKVVKSNSLSYLKPKIASEWHTTKNGNLTPDKVTETSGKKVWWICNNKKHEWKTTIASRTSYGTNCPFCELTPQSRQELTITFELKTIFKKIDPRGYKTRINGRLRAVDIYIPDLNLAIEFDGSYWHKDKRAVDKIKTEILMRQGYKVIRVREKPLKKIHSNDIAVKVPFDGKKITNEVLNMIVSMYKLPIKKLNEINIYLNRDNLQNESALDKYIDSILKNRL